MLGTGIDARDGGLWKDLKTIPDFPKLPKELEADEHPELVSVWHPRHGSSTSNVHTRLLPDHGELAETRRCDATDTQRVQPRLSTPPACSVFLRIAWGIDAYASDLDTTNRFNSAKIANHVVDERNNGR